LLAWHLPYSLAILLTLFILAVLYLLIAFIILVACIRSDDYAAWILDLIVSISVGSSTTIVWLSRLGWYRYRWWWRAPGQHPRILVTCLLVAFFAFFFLFVTFISCMTGIRGSVDTALFKEVIVSNTFTLPLPYIISAGVTLILSPWIGAFFGVFTGIIWMT